LKRDFLSYSKSVYELERLKRGVLGFEKVPLQQSLGRVLAEDIVAVENSPKYPTSSLDGFAIKIIDQQKEVLDIFESDNPAGSKEFLEIKDGFAIKTFTGSIMPKGSDTLIPVENVKVVDGKLHIEQKVSIGNGVRPIGELFRKGDTILKKGQKIGFPEIGVMASLNIVSPKVAIKPRVAILSTGSEILEIGEEATSEAQIRSSNNYTLEALVEKSGGKAIQVGIVKDDYKTISKEINNLVASGVEFIVTTGGVSVGDYDFVTDIVEKSGLQRVFHGVKIKPGQHIFIASNEKTTLFALPGFAYSSTVTAILYLLPLLRDSLGLDFENREIVAKLSQKFYKKSKKTEFTTANLEFKDGEIFANFNDKKVGTSAILTNMLQNSHLMISDENDEDLEIDSKVRIILVD
jgi:molybdopterin molybdotransferase